MLTLNTLTYSIGEKLFFNNVQARFNSGFLHTISGKNGTGKTTLLRIMHGECEVTQGLLTVDNQSFVLTSTAERARIKKYIGLVPQQAQTVIIPELTVAENLHLAAIDRVHFLSALPPIDTTLIESFNIPLAKPASVLSGGQKHILAIAMVLQQHRSVLLLDEPIAALDDENAALVMRCIAALVRKGITLIMVTHDSLTIDVPIKEWNLAALSDGTRTFVPK